MSCNNVQILNFNHNIVEIGSDNKLVITDNVKCNSITIPQPVTNILQINSPGPQGPGLSGGTNNYIPLWVGSNALTSSYLNQSNGILKTTSGSIDKGLYLNTTSDVYQIGDWNDNNPNGVRLNVSYTPTERLISTAYQGADIGLKLDFANNTYILGNLIGNGDGLIFQNGVYSFGTGSLLTDGFGLGINWNEKFVKLGDYGGISNGTLINIDDTNQQITLNKNVLLPNITSSPQSNVVTINTTTGQLYYTASSAFGGGGGSSVNTGSLLTTASVVLNTITFTKGNGSTFPITVNTGSGVSTSLFNTFTASYNTFTSSYNTGSFSGSFTGSLQGTASWAASASVAISSSYALSASYAQTSSYVVTALTASYITSSNIVGTVTSASYADNGSETLQEIINNSVVSNQTIGTVGSDYALSIKEQDTNAGLYIYGAGTSPNKSAWIGLEGTFTTAPTTAIGISGGALSIRGLTETISSSFIVTYDGNSQDGTISYISASRITFPYIGNAVITGSLLVSGSSGGFGGITGSLQGTASYALTASYAMNGGGSGTPVAILDEGNTLTSAVTSINFTGAGVAATNNGNAVTVTINGTSIDTSAFVTTSSFNAFTSSYNTATSSFVTNSQTSSFVKNNQTSSFVTNSQTSSFVQNSQTSSFVINSQTSSFVQNSQTSSFVQNSQTSSFTLNSQTSSFVTNSQTSSFVTTSSFNTFTSSIKAQSGSVASFAGRPYSASITLGTAYSNNLYAVTVTGEDARIFTISAKTSTGFTINTNSSTALSNPVYWVASSFNS